MATIAESEKALGPKFLQSIVDRVIAQGGSREFANRARNAAIQGFAAQTGAGGAPILPKSNPVGNFLPVAQSGLASGSRPATSGVTQAFLDRIGLSRLGFDGLPIEHLRRLIPQVSTADQQVLRTEIGRRGDSGSPSGSGLLFEDPFLAGGGTGSTAAGDPQLVDVDGLQGGAGQTDAKKLVDIIDRVIEMRRSNTPISGEEIITMIMESLGITDRNQVLAPGPDGLPSQYAIVLAESERLLPSGPAADGGGGPGGPDVPVPTPIGVPALTGEPARDLVDRESFFQREHPSDTRRRLIGGTFGTGLTPAGTRAAGSVFDRFQAQNPIMQFGELGGNLRNSFESFVKAPRATPDELRAGLQNVLAGGASSDFFEPNFPDVSSVVASGISPFIASLSPHLRRSMSSMFQNRAATQKAMTPEQFQNPEQLFDLLQQIVGDFQPPATTFSGAQ